MLRYLASRLDVTEIADVLFLSVHTVRSHVKAIYRKLGVERRRDALLKARQVELL